MLAVKIRITAGTSDQMEAEGSISADIRTIMNQRVRAAPLAEVAGLNDPDTGKIHIESLGDGIDD